MVGPHNPGFFNHFGAPAAAGSSSHPHSLLTQGNLANNNNGNHTSTSISESQSAATKCVTVGGKRRHNSASDGHLSASSNKGLEPGGVSSSMLLQGNDAHLASLVQAQGQGQGQPPSSSQTHGPSSLTYTGLDGKIGVDKQEHSEGRNGQGSGQGQGQGQGMHAGGKDRDRDREVLLKPMSRASNQRNVQAPVSADTTEKSDREFEQFTAKRARTTSTSRESLESNSGKDK